MEKGCTVRNKCTSIDSVWIRLSSDECESGHGDESSFDSDESLIDSDENMR